MKKKYLISIICIIIFTSAIGLSTHKNSHTLITKNLNAIADIEPQLSCQNENGTLQEGHWCFICHEPKCIIMSNMRQTSFDDYCTPE